MRRRGLRVVLCWFLGAAAVGAAALGVVGDHGSLGVGIALVGVICMVLAYDMYSEAMTQSRVNGLATTGPHQAWLLVLCVSAAAGIIGFPVNVLMIWNLYDVRVRAMKGLRLLERGGDAPDLLGLHRVSVQAILGALVAVSLATLSRLFVRPDELWRAAAPSVVGAGRRP